MVILSVNSTAINGIFANIVWAKLIVAVRRYEHGGGKFTKTRYIMELRESFS